MVNLLYPAVLGSVLYNSLEFSIQTALGTARVWSQGAVQADPDTLLKIGLITVTMLFFCCDYLYLFLTEEFLLRFFLFDVVFLLALYATVLAMHVGKGDSRTPQGFKISVCYLIFMVLYFVWDAGERRRHGRKLASLNAQLADRRQSNAAKKQPREPDRPAISAPISPEAEATPHERVALKRLRDEISLYTRVVTWEVFAIVMLTFTTLVLARNPTDRCGLELLTLVLGIVSLWFAWLIWQKVRKHQTYREAATHSELTF